MVAPPDAAINLAAERSYGTDLTNSPLLPLLLLSLIRQKNSPDTTYEIKKSYDYIVVGAGASGSVVAARLSEIPCVNVLLLEAGPPPPKLTDVMALGGNFWFTNIDWQYRTVPQKFTGRGLINRQIIWPGGKTLGGSTILSGALHVRGNRKDYDDWAAMGAKGWSYEEVLPYFKKLEDNRDPEYVANGFHGVQGPITVMRPRYDAEIRRPLLMTGESMGFNVVDPNAYTQTGFYDKQVNLRDGQRCSVAKGYLVPAENRTNLDIVANAFVTKIIIKNRRAVGVRFDIGRRSFTVRANREVILSAGTVNSAKLLMLSGIGPKEELEKFNIPVHADLPVGYNFHDHSASTVDFTLSPRIMRYQDKITDPRNIQQYIDTRTGQDYDDKHEAYGNTGLQQKNTGPLTSPYYTVLAFLANNEVDAQMDYPNLELYFAESNYVRYQRFNNLRPEVYQQVFAPYRNHSTMSCIVEHNHPRSRGFVKLQSANPYDPPIIDPNYLAHPKDVDDLVDGLKACKRIGTSYHMRQVGARLFQTLYPGCEGYAGDDDAYFRCQVATVLSTNFHPVGTAKMGDPRDPTTVVDPQLRVKKIRGLRVVDNSIMPKIITGNTGVPAMMIGEKASDIIKSTIDCKRYEWDNKGRLYGNPSPFDSEYDSEDKILLSPKTTDDFNEDYDYFNIESDGTFSDNSGTQNLYSPGSNYNRSPIRGFQDPQIRFSTNRNRYANFNNQGVAYGPFNSEILTQTSYKKR